MKCERHSLRMTKIVKKNSPDSVVEECVGSYWKIFFQEAVEIVWETEAIVCQNREFLFVFFFLFT